MATVDLTAASLTENGGWTRAAGASDLAAIQSDDGATSYFYVPNTTSDTGYNLFWGMSTMPAASSITSLVQTGSFGRNGTAAGNYRFRHKVGSTSYNSEGVTNRAFPASWTAATSNATSYGPGGSWTTTNINSTSFGVTNQADSTTAGRRGYQSYFIVTVDYTPLNATFLPLFFNGLAGALFLPEMVQKLAGHLTLLAYGSRAVYTPEELDQIKEEIRMAQRGYSFLGVAA